MRIRKYTIDDSGYLYKITTEVYAAKAGQRVGEEIYWTVSDKPEHIVLEAALEYCTHYDDTASIVFVRLEKMQHENVFLFDEGD